MRLRPITRFLGFVAFGAALLAPVAASAESTDSGFEASFDRALGTDIRAPRDFAASYRTPLERQVALLASGEKGRIGVAAIDLATGEEVSVLGDQRFPLASTSKIAIAATFLEGVEQGRWRLDDKFPLMVPVGSKPFSSPVAPVRAGELLPAQELMELMLTRSSNSATDALLRVIGGPSAVNDWMRRAGIREFRIDRDIATLVRDDGEIDPSRQIDQRDSATPRAMAELLKGLYEGRWLSRSSRDLLIATMERCVTGKRRIPALMPEDVVVAHKTGSLNNTSSDVGIIKTSDGRVIAVAIYVTGQGSRPGREDRIATIARAIYDGYAQPASEQRAVLVNASY